MSQIVEGNERAVARPLAPGIFTTSDSMSGVKGRRQCSLFPRCDSNWINNDARTTTSGDSWATFKPHWAM
eukprot:scaffold115025_cov26-Prasinocladus_malaysianus.AAC.1